MRWLKDGKVQEYSATDEDALTLARAVAREGAPREAVAWTLAQRFALLYPRYPTLAKFVEAYSQTINPRWFPDGDLHIKRIRRLEGNAAAQADEQRRALRRVEFASKGWDELPNLARQRALEAIEGGESPVPGSVHFRASKAPTKATKKQAFHLAQRFADSRSDLTGVVRLAEGYGPKVNWFFQSPGSSRIQLLADEEDPLIPKDEAPAGFPKPPEGLPQGEGWGWAWCFSPSYLSQPESEKEKPEPSEPDCSPSPEDEPEAEQAEAQAEDDEPPLPAGAVVSIADARELFPSIADDIDDAEASNANGEDLDEAEGHPA